MTTSSYALPVLGTTRTQALAAEIRIEFALDPEKRGLSIRHFAGDDVNQLVADAHLLIDRFAEAFDPQEFLSFVRAWITFDKVDRPTAMISAKASRVFSGLKKEVSKLIHQLFDEMLRIKSLQAPSVPRKLATTEHLSISHGVALVMWARLRMRVPRRFGRIYKK